MPDTHLVVLDPGQLDDSATIAGVLPASVPATVLDPLGDGFPPGPPPGPRARAAALAAAVEVAGPVTVVAHCTNAALAYELTAALETRGTAVASLVIFAPVQVDAELVRAHAVTLLAALGGSAEAADRDWAGNPVGALTAVVGELRAAALSRAADMGFDHEDAQQFARLLTERYESWLGHLAGHIGVTVPAPSCPVHVVDTHADAGIAVARRIAPATDLHGWPASDPVDFADAGLQARMVVLCTKEASL